MRWIFFALESDKLIIIIKLPILNNVEPFAVVTLTSLPVMINGKFYKIDNLGEDTAVAVGKRFRVMIDVKKCKKFNKHLYCNSLSEHRLKNESKTCIGSILNNDESVMNKCSLSEVVNMEDTFRKSSSGQYFYSVSKPLKFEFLCVNGLENDQIILEGLGSIIIKKDCFTKHDEILLVGKDIYK